MLWFDEVYEDWVDGSPGPGDEHVARAAAELTAAEKELAVRGEMPVESQRTSISGGVSEPRGVSMRLSEVLIECLYTKSVHKVSSHSPDPCAAQLM